MSAEELKFVKTQLKWADSEKLDPAQGNYVKWRLKIRDWLIYNGLWCLIEPVKPEQQQDKAKVAVEEDVTQAGRPSVRCMTAIRESVCASLGNRIQLVTNPREAWELLKPTITDEDEHAWISRVEHIQVSEFKSYLEFLDALQVLFNNMQIYVPDKKDWTEERVVKCGVRALRCRWDDWQLVIEFYSELEDKIKEAEGKELAGYTMQFFFKKVTKCAKQMKLRRDCQASGGRSPGVAMMAQAPAHARPPPHPPYQDKPCFDYQAGHCPRGSSCKFSHSASFGSRGGSRGGRGGRGGGRGPARGGHRGGRQGAAQSQRQPFTGTCHNCGRTGHKKHACNKPPPSVNLAVRSSNVYQTLSGHMSYLADAGDVDLSGMCQCECECVWC